MKHLLVLSLMMLISTSSIFAQHKAMSNKDRKSPHETVSGNGVSVTYGRPYMKGRAIFGSLVPYGEVWRTGADEATEITFAHDATFGGKKVKAGTYTLFTIPNKTEWTIILNKKLGQWGAFDYDKVKSENVLETKVPATVGVTISSIEEFTISFPPNEMRMQWENTSVSVPIN